MPLSCGDGEEASAAVSAAGEVHDHDEGAIDMCRDLVERIGDLG
jgi:hypothetical protein